MRQLSVGVLFLIAIGIFNPASSQSRIERKAIAKDKKLIKGHWISVDDNKYHLLFSRRKKKDVYDGETTYTGKYWIDNRNNLIVVQKSDTLQYGIMSLSKQHLTLMYLSRGNLLTFHRK